MTPLPWNHGEPPDDTWLLSVWQNTTDGGSFYHLVHYRTDPKMRLTDFNSWWPGESDECQLQGWIALPPLEGAS